MTENKIYNIIYNDFKTTYDRGFTNDELINLINIYFTDISFNDLSNILGVRTVTIINDLIINYKHDVYNAILKYYKLN
jgi:hypothetical protein